MRLTVDPASFEGTSRFQIVRLLGAGGMGFVYEALDREQNAHVALKTLRAIDPGALLRFKHEFRTVQDVVHPNLVRLGELIEDAGHWFFTMELVEGTDLLSYVSLGDGERDDRDDDAAPPTVTAGAPRGSTSETAALPDLRAPERDPEPDRPWRFSEARLRDAFAQLAEGLDGLHCARLVHRDVKPSNVLVMPSGRVVILDFGIASEVASVADPRLLAMGTFAFMSPEQLAGAAPQPASDCYAIGVTLYQALTGVLPLRGKTRDQLLLAKLHVPPRPPHEHCPDVPPDLEALCLALLEPDPAHRPSSAEVASRLRQPAAVPPATARSRPDRTVVPRFLGRAAELQALDAALADSRADGDFAVVMTGDSGIGKTALMRRFRDVVEASHPDALVLPGRCHERESVPYKAVDGVIDALSHHLGRLDDDAIAPLLPEAIDALCHVFPVLHQVDAIARRRRVAPRGDRADTRRRVFGGLRELFGAMGERAPLVILIDDLQWADADSMALLEEVLRPPAPRLLLVATLRGPADSPVALGELALRRIHLEPLDAEDARRLALRHLREAGPTQAALAEALAREAAGHPLFIAELVQHLAGGAEHATGAAGSAAPVGSMTRGGEERSPTAPTQVRLDDALRRRIARLEAPTRRLLELVAIAGVPLPQHLLADVLGLSYADLAGQIATLRAGRLLSTSGARPGDLVEPYHDRISESLRAGLPPEVTRQWHARLVDALEPMPGASPEMLSVHLAGAGQPRRAAEYAVRAAQQAADALAFERSVRLLRRAVELHAASGDDADGAQTYRLETALARALVDAGRSCEAAEVFTRAAAHAPPAEALDLRRRAGEAYLVGGEVDRGVDTISALIADLGLPQPRRRSGMLASIGLSRARIRWRGLRYHLRDASAVDPALLLTLDIAWAANMGLAFVDVLQSTWFQQQYILRALGSGDRLRVVRALVAEAGVSAAGGGRTAARTAAIVDEVSALGAGLARPYERGVIGTIGALTAHLEGRFADVVTRAEKHIGDLERAGHPSSWDLGTMRMMLLHGLFMTGRTREMVARTDEILRGARDRGDHYEGTLLRTGVQNHVWLVRGDSHTARRVADDAVRGWSKRGTLVHAYLDLIAQNAIDLYEDPDTDRAYQRIVAGWGGLRREFLLNFEAGRTNCHEMRGRATVAAARSAAPSRRKALLRAAEKDVAVIERQAQPAAAPLAATLRAAVLHQRGDDDGAVRWLRAAAAGFDDLGMALYACAARRRLGALVSGDEGRALVAGADARMTEEAIKEPARMAAMLVAGFGLG